MKSRIEQTSHVFTNYTISTCAVPFFLVLKTICTKLAGICSVMLCLHCWQAAASSFLHATAVERDPQVDLACSVRSHNQSESRRRQLQARMPQPNTATLTSHQARLAEALSMFQTKFKLSLVLVKSLTSLFSGNSCSPTDLPTGGSRRTLVLLNCWVLAMFLELFMPWFPRWVSLDFEVLDDSRPDPADVALGGRSRNTAGLRSKWTLEQVTPFLRGWTC